MRKLALILFFLLLSTVNTFADNLDTLKQQAEAGDMDAQFNLALEYWGDFEKREYAAAIPWLLKAAEQGHDQAAYYLGSAYVIGRGVHKNGIEAVKWFKRAIELGNTEGYHGIGRMYFTGSGIDRDYDKAYAWWSRGAALGDERCKGNLEQYYENDKPIKTPDAMIAKAQNGDPEAQYELGQAYVWGRAVPRDFEQSAYWLRKAARAGNMQAQSYLGSFSLLLNDYVSLEESRQWLEKAALQGDAGSLSMLIYGYLMGLDNGYDKYERSHAQAVKWLKVGVAKGDKSSLIMAAPLFAMGVLEPHDDNYAVGLLIKAALIKNENDSYTNAHVMSDVARLYIDKRISVEIPETTQLPPPPNTDTGEINADTQNYADAAKWYYQAALLGHAESQYYLARLYEDGLGIAQNRAEADHFYALAFEQMEKNNNHPYYLYPLADMYARGRGTAVNITEALTALQKLYTEDRGELWLGGDTIFYRDAARELAAEIDKTATKAQKKAANWDTGGFIFYNNGQPFDFETTLQKAAEGDNNARYELAARYLEGVGVKPDYRQALHWLTLVAESGDPKAMYALATASLFNDNGYGPEAQDIKWYIKSAQAGYAPAQHWLSMIYESGWSIERDFVQSYYWAARNYLNPAKLYDDKHILERQQKDMTPQQLEEARKLLEKDGFVLPEIQP